MKKFMRMIARSSQPAKYFQSEKYAISALIVAIGAFSGTEIAAQDTGVSLEEIIVTANKREEGVQNVPISIAVISGEKAEESGFTSILDVAKLVPGITFQERQDRRTGTFAIRGIATPQTYTGAEPSAAIMLDGETFARSSSFHNDLVDVERIEVLKGPQGTLFGKNVSVGAIHIISKRPSLDETYGELSILTAEDQEFRFKGAYNALLSNNTALRVNALFKDVNGWVPNIRPEHPDGGESDSYGFRAQLLRQLSQNTDLLWRVEYSKQNFGPGTRVWIELANPDSNVHQVSQTPYGPDNDRTSQIGTRNYGDLENFGTSFEINHAMGDYGLTYQGSYRDYKLYTDEDQSALAVNIFPIYFGGPTNSQTTQHELRLASPVGGFLDYVLGTFFYYENTFRSEEIDTCVGDPGLNQSQIDPVTFEVLTCPNTSNFTFLNGDLDGRQVVAGVNDGYFILRTDSTTLKKYNYALFGQANWHFTDKLNLITGLRFLHEQQDLDFNSRISGITDYAKSVTDNHVLFKVGLQYQIDDDIMTYATYSTGYKGVAWFNTPDFTADDIANDTYPTDPEESSQFEIGLRSDLLNNRLRLNVSIFRMEIDGFQERASKTDPTFGGITTNKLINAGTVVSQGVEIDGVALLSDQFQLGFSANYLDSTYDSDVYVSCVSAAQDAQINSACVVGSGGSSYTNLNGLSTSNAPKWQFNLSGRYDFTLPENYTAHIRGDYRWKDDEASTYAGISKFIKDAHGIADIYLSVSSPNERYNLNLFVKNVFDKQYYSHHSSGDGFFGTIIGYDNTLTGTVPRDFNRYVGVNLTMRF